VRVATAGDAATRGEAALKPPVPFDAETERPMPSALPRPLDNWTLEDLPDGTARLYRTRHAALKSIVEAMVILALFGALGLLTYERGSHHAQETGGDIPWWGPSVFFLFFAGVGLGLLLWRAFGREEWLLREDQIEVRRRLLGYAWSRYYRDEKLLVRVFATAAGGVVPHVTWQLWVTTGRKRRLLHTGSVLPAEVVALGDLVAERTGLELDVPMDMPFIPPAGTPVDAGPPSAGS
jgi:hypothetical protein